MIKNRNNRLKMMQKLLRKLELEESTDPTKYYTMLSLEK